MLCVIRPPSRRVLAAMLMLAGGLGRPALAQLRLGAATDRDRYIAYEPIQLSLRIRNDSGNALTFEEYPGREALRLTCQRDGVLRPETRNATALIEGLQLAPGQERVLTVQINENFTVAKGGRYELTAQIGHPRFRFDFRTQPILFEVLEGAPEWTRELGVPELDDAAPIRDRQVSLLVVPDKPYPIYALQVRDDEFIYALKRLGRRIIAAPPDCDIDAMSNIHILMRLSSRLFVHRVFDYNGGLKQEGFRVLDNTTPGLYRDPDKGVIRVVGGSAAVEGTDYTILPGGEATATELAGPQ